jgi:hypothetical protein
MQEEMKELNSPAFSAGLLNAVFKLFFKRAPEMKKVLQSVFKEII